MNIITATRGNMIQVIEHVVKPLRVGVCGFFVDRFCNSAPQRTLAVGGFLKKGFCGLRRNPQNPFRKASCRRRRAFYPRWRKWVLLEGNGAGAGGGEGVYLSQP